MQKVASLIFVIKEANRWQGPIIIISKLSRMDCVMII
jgi:hypothetical protein